MKKHGIPLRELQIDMHLAIRPDVHDVVTLGVDSTQPVAILIPKTRDDDILVLNDAHRLAVARETPLARGSRGYHGEHQEKGQNKNS